MGERDDDEQGTPRTRREVIAKAGVVGAVAWTAPVVASLASPAAAATQPPPPPPPPPSCITFTDFSDLSAFSLNATQGDSPPVAVPYPYVGPGNEMRLTDNNQGLAASAWLTTPKTVAYGFTSDFRFRLNGGADGIAFVVQNQATNALGLAGGFMGYSGITNSLAVECDIFDNGPTWDPNANHIAVHSNGTAANSADGTSPPMVISTTDSSLSGVTLSDGSVHRLHVAYDGTDLTVSLDANPLPLLTVTGLDLGTLLSLGPSGVAWVGFTAGTGAATAEQDILDWTFCSTPAP